MRWLVIPGLMVLLVGSGCGSSSEPLSDASVGADAATDSGVGPADGGITDSGGSLDSGGGPDAGAGGLRIRLLNPAAAAAKMQSPAGGNYKTHLRVPVTPAAGASSSPEHEIRGVFGGPRHGGN